MGLPRCLTEASIFGRAVCFPCFACRFQTQEARSKRPITSKFRHDGEQVVTPLIYAPSLLDHFWCAPDAASSSSVDMLVMTVDGQNGDGRHSTNTRWDFAPRDHLPGR